MSEVTLRPMTVDDVPAAERLSAVAFHAVDLARRLPGDPEPAARGAAAAARWVARTTALVRSEAGGCWVTEEAGEVLGFATSLVRGDLWVLATFAVRPGVQGRGLGRRLLEAAGGHGAGCRRAMLAASDDPRALRRYWAAGFELHPQVVLSGRVDRDRLPASPGVAEGGAGDLGWITELDLQRRGAAHSAADHRALAAAGPLLVAPDRRGYAYAGAQGPELLAARDDAAARDLLAACLARVEGEASVDHVTGSNQWAVDVAMSAGLRPRTRGYLALRGMSPPTPYLHHGALL